MHELRGPYPPTLNDPLAQFSKPPVITDEFENAFEEAITQMPGFDPVENAWRLEDERRVARLRQRQIENGDVL